MNYFSVFVVPVQFWRNVIDGGGWGGFSFCASTLFLPLGITYTSLHLCLKFDASSYEFLVSVFSIFSAFLFASQISAFTIYKGKIGEQSTNLQRKLEDCKKDEISKARIEGDHAAQRESMSKGFIIVNCAISYLVLLSVWILIALICLNLSDNFGLVLTAILIFFIAHFFCVLLFTIGQSHEVFSVGYDHS